jgi:hypothetical protein
MAFYNTNLECGVFKYLFIGIFILLISKLIIITFFLINLPLAFLRQSRRMLFTPLLVAKPRVKTIH